MMEFTALIVHALVLAAVLCQVHSQVDPDLKRLCNAQSFCRDCIRASHLCSWCVAEDFPSTSPRCYPTGYPDVTCEAGKEQNPKGGTANTNSVPLQGVAQVSPVRIDVSVRPGAPVTFSLDVRPSRNYPIDLYVLMDLSYSMHDDLANLKRLGAALASGIVEITNNFTIGFGSFVDKVLGPFTSVNPRYRNNPCLGGGKICRPAYSYRHTVTLTKNQTFFNEQVQAQNISGNNDIPEGGFDGFLQSLVCTELIGWRDLSRKLLLYITDAGFHYANDGKLGGVVLPNDGLCRLSKPTTPGAEVDYNDWDVYDYPSIGQIVELLRRNDVIPIFAVVETLQRLYKALKMELGNGAGVGTLASDSSNVVQLVRDQYDTIAQRILFDPEAVPGVSLKFTPTNCPGTVTADGICTGVQIQQTARFNVSVSLTECNAQNSGRVISMPVRVIGFGSFTIRLSAICECGCESNSMVNSTSCSEQGNLTCGICECNEGYLGDQCQCDATGAGGTELMCPVGPTEIQCTRSDRGSCVCGRCICRTNSQGEPLFYGLACECDNSRCGRVKGLLCSGRGTCTCNGCQCQVEPTTKKPYFNGDARACECTPATDCIDPRNSTDPCNGHGTCGCDGTCQCVPPYSGTYCEICSGSSECIEYCHVNLVCAQCALDVIAPYATTLSSDEFFSSSVLSRDGIPSGSMFNVTGGTYQLILPPANDFCDRVNTTAGCPSVVIINGTNAVNYEIDGIKSVRCESTVGECTYRYFVAADVSGTFNPDENRFAGVHVEYLRSCPKGGTGTAPWIIAIGIIIPLIILGVLALVLLKIILVILDAVEVRNFEKELERSKHSHNENPLYRSAIVNYDNPIYGKE